MPNVQPLTPNLLSIADKINNLSESIASQWILIPTVKAIFISYKISSNKFKDGFAIPIIEYFIFVVKEEKSAGNCPIMSKLVIFLLDKNITPKDVFDICMGFRRVLISSLFKEGLIKDNSLEIMDEIASLFDANLSGVLEIFTSFYKKQQKHIDESVTQQKKYSQILKIINFINTKVFIVQNERIIMGNKSFFDTLGVNNLKEFKSRYEDTFSFMNDINEYKEDFDSRKIENWISEVIGSNKPFKTSIYNNKYSKSFIYSGRITTLPDISPTQYIVTLNSIDSHLEDQSAIKESIYHDKLTGLNNYTQFEHLLGEEQRKATNGNIRLALVIVDIPQLKEINEKEGYESGNKTIIAVAKDIQLFSDDKMILAHLEGSRFGILMPYETEQECYDRCCQLYKLLVKKPHNKTVSVTSFNLAEKISSLLMRVYNLSDIQYSSNNSIRTDFEDIVVCEILPEQAPFIERLKDLKNVAFSVYYKELPIISSNEIIHLNEDSVVVKFSAKQISIMRENGFVYFQLPSFGYVKAHIRKIDTLGLLVTINKFRLDIHSPLQRKKFRIEAHDNLMISIASGRSVFQGTVLNLNLNSIAVKLEGIGSLEDGKLISLVIMININEKIISFTSNASVYRIEKFKDAYKVVLECIINKGDEILSNYISKRQMEVIKEINNKPTSEYSI